MSYLLPIAIFLFVLAPVLFPAAISVVHAGFRWRRAYWPALAPMPERMTSTRLLAPAAA
jgi:hypothetical protein